MLEKLKATRQITSQGARARYNILQVIIEQEKLNNKKHIFYTKDCQLEGNKIQSSYS